MVFPLFGQWSIQNEFNFNCDWGLTNRYSLLERHCLAMTHLEEESSNFCKKIFFFVVVEFTRLQFAVEKYVWHRRGANLVQCSKNFDDVSFEQDIDTFDWLTVLNQKWLTMNENDWSVEVNFDYSYERNIHMSSPNEEKKQNIFIWQFQWEIWPR